MSDAENEVIVEVPPEPEEIKEEQPKKKDLLCLLKEKPS